VPGRARYIGGMRTLVATTALVLISSAAIAFELLPIESISVRGDYLALASCAFVKLDESEGGGLKKVDLIGQSRIMMEPTGSRVWELRFISTGRGQTRVDYSHMRAAFGNKNERPMAAVRSCAP